MVFINSSAICMSDGDANNIAYLLVVLEEANVSPVSLIEFANG